MMKRIIKKALLYLHNFIKFMRDGGVSYVYVAQVNKGDILKGKKVLITGGSAGIGYAIADKFLSEGASVVISGRDQKKLDDAILALNSPNVYPLRWDAADVLSAKEKLSEVVRILGGLDILINNAGVYKNDGFFCVDEKLWDYVMNTNIKGLFFICQAAVDYFTQNQGEQCKKIVNISSIRGTQGDCGPYGISKWGVNCLTKGMARDLITKNILVNAIAPGITATNINGINICDNAHNEEPKNNRVCLPEEIAELALYLASDASNNVVGQIIACDGGTTAI